MSNGEMLKNIKELIESGDDFTAKQYRILTLSGIIEIGGMIHELREEIKVVDDKAMTRICPAVEQAQKDIGKLEAKSNRNDLMVTIAAIAGSIGAAIFGSE